MYSDVIELGTQTCSWYQNVYTLLMLLHQYKRVHVRKLIHCGMFDCVNVEWCYEINSAGGWQCS